MIFEVLIFKLNLLVPLDGHWGRWSSWESCDQDCGPGKQNRTRTCDNPAPKYGGKDCVGDSKSIRDCMIKKCGLGEILYSEFH